MLERADNRKHARYWRTTEGGGPEKKAPSFDPVEADRAYNNYLENCRRLGAEPMSWDNFQDRMVEWSNAIAAALTKDRY